VLHAAAAARPLVGAASGNGPDGQPRGPRPGVVIRDAGQPRVDDIPDPGDRDGGLGDVGGHDDLPVRDRDEDLPLFLGRQSRVQGKDLHPPAVPPL